jgi:hypothetical protein
MLVKDFEVLPVGTRDKLRKLAALRAEVEYLRMQLALAKLAMKFTDADIDAMRTVVMKIAYGLDVGKGNN